MYQQQQQPMSSMSIEQLHNFAINLIHLICSVFTMPVEIILRPQYGTRYFPIPVTFFSAVMMILLPLFSSLANGMIHMIPFVSVPPQPGLFGIGSFSALYFFLVFVHAIRLYRRMIYMDLELHSEFEGPALPFFRMLPRGSSFWFTRIVLEPAFVFFAASLLQASFIIQSGLATYLHCAALMLVIRNFIYWYRVWEMIRVWRDMTVTGPIIGKFAAGTATEDDLAPIHLASLPRNLSPDMRQAAVAHIARAFGEPIPASKTEPNNKER
jgi:hypothetical protein